MGSSSNSSSSSDDHDFSFKILLIGDASVGKTSLISSFVSKTREHLSPTIGNTSSAHHLLLYGIWNLKFSFDFFIDHEMGLDCIGMFSSPWSCLCGVRNVIKWCLWGAFSMENGNGFVWELSYWVSVRVSRIGTSGWREFLVKGILFIVAEFFRN